MAQTITHQTFTGSISANGNGSLNGQPRNPVVIATAPNTGCSRVIIQRLTLKNSGPDNQITGGFKLLLTIGQTSYGYSTIGGFNTNSTVGLISFPQASGEGAPVRYVPSGIGFNGGIVVGNSTLFCNTGTANYTPKNIPALNLGPTQADASVQNTIPLQFWVTPGDEIGLKLSANINSTQGYSTPSPYEITSSLMFITEI